MKKIAFLSALGMIISYSALATSTYVKDIKISGLERVEPETVLSYIDVKENSSIKQEKFNESLKQLYSTGLFSDVNFKIEPNGDLLINITENPIVNKRVFDGNEKLDSEMLEKEVSLAPRSIYSRAKVQQDVERILNIYKRTGRYAVTVSPKIIQRDQNRIDLVYEIIEGPVANISKINFIGNKRYSDKDLQSTIMSKESRWFRVLSSSENYDAEKTNYDKELLRRFYLKQGFADFRVVSAIAELTPNKESFVVNYNIDEGKRYKINKIEIVSDIKDIDIETLNKEVLYSTGDWYNDQKTDKTISVLTEELGKKSFAFVSVVPELIKNTKTGEVDVIFNIKEGARYFVDKINITGNIRTHDKVIRRAFRIDEGDAFNASKIKDSRRNVENLNYFSKVDISTSPKGLNKADLNVNVEEKSTGYFNVGLGYSTVNGALIKTGVVENNFKGLGQQLGLDISISGRTSEYDISFTEPYFMGRPLSAGFDLFRTETDYQDEASYDSETTGGRFRLGWKYTDNLSQYLRYTLKNDEISNVSDDASIYVREEAGERLGSVIGQTVVYDKRDSSIAPKEGYYVSFGNDVAGLGGDEKYFKFDTKAYKFYTLADHYTFKLFLNAGYILPYAGEDITLSNRYYLGGTTLRGFDTAGIGARDKATNDSLGGNWMLYTGSELSFPMGLDELGIKGKTFIDIGMLGKPDNADSAGIEYSSIPRVAAGFGFEWMSPMGQIDIDFAFPIVKEDYDETQVFRLNFGTRL